MSGTIPSVTQAALRPQPGMWRIPLSLESYQHPSPPLSSKMLLNMFVEIEPADARVAAALVPTPGLVGIVGAVCGTGPVLAMNSDFPGRTYVYSGTHFYRMYQDVGGPLTIDDLGDCGSPAGADFSVNLMATIAVGTTAAVLCVPPNAFTCSHAEGSPLNQIGGTFPGANSVATMDGYYVFTCNNLTAQFFSSLLLDPSDYDALDFATAEGVPNILRRVMVLNDELWLFGDDATEVWQDAGAADFPFRRVKIIPYGAIAMRSICVCDSSLFWVTQQGIVVRSEGYNAVRVSTHAIEYFIRTLATVNIACALSYTQDGHVFYVLTIGPLTMVYDCSTKVWHYRSSSADGSQAWLPSAAGSNRETPVFGTFGSGLLFVPTPTVDTDNGITVLRQVVLPPVWGGTNRVSCNRLEIEMESGGSVPTGDVTVDWSDDGGITYTGGPRVMNAGIGSDRTKRVYTTRLGSFRQRVFRISASHRMTVYAVDADLTQGNA